MMRILQVNRPELPKMFHECQAVLLSIASAKAMILLAVVAIPVGDGKSS